MSKSSGACSDDLLEKGKSGCLFVCVLCIEVWFIYSVWVIKYPCLKCCFVSSSVVQLLAQEIRPVWRAAPFVREQLSESFVVCPLLKMLFLLTSMRLVACVDCWFF